MGWGGASEAPPLTAVVNCKRGRGVWPLEACGALVVGPYSCTCQSSHDWTRQDKAFRLTEHYGNENQATGSCLTFYLLIGMDILEKTFRCTAEAKKSRSPGHLLLM